MVRDNYTDLNVHTQQKKKKNTEENRCKIDKRHKILSYSRRTRSRVSTTMLKAHFDVALIAHPTHIRIQAMSL